MTHLNKEGSPEIKEKYLAPSITGEKIGCLCITEPFGGSDVSGMRTTAVKKGETYVINGSKTFITNGIYSDYLVVAAKTTPELGGKGISIFVMDRDTPGISSTKLDKLGWRASDTAEIAFDNVTIPASNLMGEENMGFPYIMQHFALERLVMAINAHARAEFALEYAIGYMKERTAFGKSISKFQALRHNVAQMASDIEVCKTFNYNTTKRLNDGEYVVKEATMAKLTATKMSDEVMYQCLQLLGGYGYMEEYPLARMFRDSRLGPIGGGTSEILKEILAKMIIDGKEYKPAT
jgi:alkylation response protein AidB-like acyl-CoA dehydrogenase